MEHVSHQHPLILRDKRDDGSECYGCCLPISGGPTYDCSKCEEFLLHKSCGELPKQIQHPFHPLHPLTFHYDPGKLSCYACGKLCFGFVFHCEDCNFALDVRCASLLPTIKYEGHEHLLTLFNKIHGRKRCNFCYTRCDTFILRCVICDFSVHKSCIELPEQLQHPFHPHHPLTIVNCLKHQFPYSAMEEVSCDACHVKALLCTFRCKDCCFNLCIDCASLLPTIKYEGHGHLLTLFENIYDHQQCNSCGTPCSALVLRCVDCDFNLHLDCFPSLPRTIRHKCHIDPLTLTDSVAEEEGDDSDEFYCDACEKERNPKVPVYYCADCHFVAQIGCVISEVLPSLERYSSSSSQHGGLELDTSKISVREANCKVLSEGLVVEVEGIEPKESEQESNAGGKKTEMTYDFTVGEFLGFTIGDEVMERGDFATVTSEKVGIGSAADPTLAELDEEIAKLQVVVETLTKKLEELKDKRAHWRSIPWV